MEYIKFSDIGEKQWDAYLENIQGSTFNYLSNKMKFDLEYSIYVQQNESFLLISDKKAIGVAIVYIEELNHIKSVSWSLPSCTSCGSKVVVFFAGKIYGDVIKKN